MLIIPSLSRQQTFFLAIAIIAGLALLLSVFSRSLLPSPPA